MHLLLALALVDGLDYGSYGRVAASTDLEGGPGVATNVVSHGPRLEESPYLELDLYYGKSDPVPWRVVTSIALAGELFHSSGTFAADIAIRNLYLQVAVEPWLSVWAGSRMYRGDDIYLFDFWPLDNLNTVGAGAFFTARGWELALHAGVNRLDDSYQFETLDQPSPSGGPPEQQIVLDRVRAIESFKLTRMFAHAKASLYFEAHELGEGTFVDPTTRMNQPLPDDHGFVLGAQVGVWGRPNTYANLWLRGATGLAAYGELAVPFAVDSDKRAAGARELLVAAAGNWDGRHLGVLAGAYARYFSPAGPGPAYWEGVLAVRPHWFVTPVFGVAAEASVQGRSVDALDPVTNDPLGAGVLKLTAMPAVVTLGSGTLGRPQLRVVYTASFLDTGARSVLWRTDERLGQDTVHYLGVQAEWWFNSAYR